MVGSRKNTGLPGPRAEIASSHRHLCLFKLSIWQAAFLKLKEARLSLQEKYLTVLTANKKKIGTFKQKLDFLKMRICLYEFDSFPIHTDFPDEITGDANKYYVLILYMKRISIWKIFKT